jgi:hypothetical protein
MEPATTGWTSAREQLAARSPSGLFSGPRSLPSRQPDRRPAGTMDPSSSQRRGTSRLERHVRWAMMSISTARRGGSAQRCRAGSWLAGDCRRTSPARCGRRRAAANSRDALSKLAACWPQSNTPRRNLTATDPDPLRFYRNIRGPGVGPRPRVRSIRQSWPNVGLSASGHTRRWAISELTG